MSSYISFVGSRYEPLNNNVEFFMFENFDMNQQSFIDELEILSIIKANR